jgi:hypothetical protein
MLSSAAKWKQNLNSMLNKHKSVTSKSLDSTTCQMHITQVHQFQCNVHVAEFQSSCLPVLKFLYSEIEICDLCWPEICKEKKG